MTALIQDEGDELDELDGTEAQIDEWAAESIAGTKSTAVRHFELWRSRLSTLLHETHESEAPLSAWQARVLGLDARDRIRITTKMLRSGRTDVWIGRIAIRLGLLLSWSDWKIELKPEALGLRSRRSTLISKIMEDRDSWDKTGRPERLEIGRQLRMAERLDWMARKLGYGLLLLPATILGFSE